MPSVKVVRCVTFMVLNSFFRWSLPLELGLPVACELNVSKVISSWLISITVCIKAFFLEFGYPAFESFHEIKVVQGTLRRKSVTCEQTLSEHSHKLKTKEWSEWMVYCSISAGLPVMWDNMNLDIQPFSAACSCSIVVGIFISLPKILIGFVF